MKRVHRFLGMAALLLAVPLGGQEWDLGKRAADALSVAAEGKLKIGAEFRGRYETRSGVNFTDAETETGLLRTRLSMSYQPVRWIRFAGMLQDGRAPGYGPGAPNSVRDPADLQEAYFELFPEAKKGFGMTAGRAMLNYGETRLIGAPQWSNLSRTFDHARLYYRTGRARLEVLVVSPVKVRIGEFNRPVLGDRVWGTYNSFPELFGKNLLEAYILRRDQNRPGGFTGGAGAGKEARLGINSFGFRLAGPLAGGWKYSLEGVLQTGEVGAATHRAGAWFSSVAKRWTVAGRPLDWMGEYKWASGTGHPADAGRVGTFDPLYAANHDKFGHQDLFGWRNLRDVRSLHTLGLSKRLEGNFMYSSFWLASERDALYSGSGKALARSVAGTAGRHVGQEADLFVTFKFRTVTLGAGYGYFFKGEFVRNTTPGVNSSYAYIFHTYSFQ